MSHMKFCDSESNLMIMSLGKNPMSGGSPPRENKARKHNILDVGWGIVVNCLK